MIPASVVWGIVVFELIQMIIAFIAVVLAIRWKKREFLPGLLFLFIYAVLEAIDVTLFTLMQQEFIDVAQFGFILLAIVFFIIGMNPSFRHFPSFSGGSSQKQKKSPRESSIFTDLKKL